MPGPLETVLLLIVSGSKVAISIAVLVFSIRTWRRLGHIEAELASIRQQSEQK